MGISPIAYDVALMFIFCILGIIPHCTWEWWFIIYNAHNPMHMFYLEYMWLNVLVVDPEEHDWWVFVLSVISGAHEWFDVCVECELWITWLFLCLCWAPALEHMSYEIFVLSTSFEAHGKIRIGSVGHNPWSIPSWCWG